MGGHGTTEIGVCEYPRFAINVDVALLVTPRINHGRAVSSQIDTAAIISLLSTLTVPLGIKRERGAGSLFAQRRGCPRNCKRRIFRHRSTGLSGPGKATAGTDPRARRPAVSSGHTRARPIGVCRRKETNHPVRMCGDTQVRGDVPQGVLPEVYPCIPISASCRAACAAAAVLL